MDVLLSLIKIILMMSPLLSIGIYGLVKVKREHQKEQENKTWKS
ncbi:hypothetical protein [uncultured Croceitalea sp.]